MFNMIWTILTPFYYPQYYQNLGGPTYLFDGVSGALAAMGNHPVNVVLATAFLIGVLQRRHYLNRPVVPYLIACWITAMAALGVSGPSLTRILILLPVYVVFASIGVLYVLKRFPQARTPVLALLVAAALFDIGGYMTGFSNSRGAQLFYSPAATKLGQAAETEAMAGRRVMCIVSKDANVIRYLTHDQAPRIDITEFYRRPVNPAEIHMAEFKPQVLLVENRFLADVSSLLPTPAEVERTEQFTTIRLANR
jgi:hypothetical protein